MDSPGLRDRLSNKTATLRSRRVSRHSCRPGDEIMGCVAGAGEKEAELEEEEGGMEGGAGESGKGY